MSTGARPFAQGALHIAKGDVAFLTQTIMGGLLGPGYTPAYDTHEFWNQIVANQADDADTGYPAGGVVIGNKALTVVAASSLSAWTAATAYVPGDFRRPTSPNGHGYRCVVGGTSGSSQPTWPTGSGREVDDNGVIWVESGTAFVKYDVTADIVITPVDFETGPSPIRYMAIFKAGTAGVNDYLLGLLDFGASYEPVGTLTIKPADIGLIVTYLNT